MDSSLRTLQLLAEDLIGDWGELHNQAKTARIVAHDAYVHAIRTEELLDERFVTLMKTVGDQLERQDQEREV